MCDVNWIFSFFSNNDVVYSANILFFVVARFTLIEIFRDARENRNELTFFSNEFNFEYFVYKFQYNIVCFYFLFIIVRVTMKSMLSIDDEKWNFFTFQRNICRCLYDNFKNWTLFSIYRRWIFDWFEKTFDVVIKII